MTKSQKKFAFPCQSVSGTKADAAQVAEQPRSASAYHVAFSIVATRTMILERVAPNVPPAALSPLKPAQELHEEIASSNPVVARANR
jgi:hypothetical protein